jgi:hypothetical protein
MVEKIEMARCLKKFLGNMDQGFGKKKGLPTHLPPERLKEGPHKALGLMNIIAIRLSSRFSTANR